MHGVAHTSINDPETQNQHHDHAGSTAMLLDTTYNTPTDRTIGSATHHEVPIVRRDQRPGTASTPSSFVALEDDMSGARTGDGITVCIAGSSPSTRDHPIFLSGSPAAARWTAPRHGGQGVLWTAARATDHGPALALCTMTQ